jgi:hypothetical protein
MTTLSLKVIFWPAVVIPASSVVVAPEPSSVTEAFPVPVIRPLTRIEPPLGVRKVTGSVKVTASISMAWVPSDLPIAIELNPLVRLAISVVEREKFPVAPAMPIDRPGDVG